MKVGFLGIQCDNPNLGVAALAYAGVHLVHRAAPAGAEFVLFSDNTADGIARMQESLDMSERPIRALPFRHKHPGKLWRSIREIADCDVVVDFSGGDSFADIYGLRRLFRLLFHKEIAILCRTPLVLAPQTYGPFTRSWVLPGVRHAVQRAQLVFARDSLSRDWVATITDRPVHLTTDVAVTLPFSRPQEAADDGVRVAFNVSGLLWAGGYTGDNQFGLRADYREYCNRVVSALLEAGHDVELIAHVYSGGDEDDYIACRALQAGQPRATLGPRFATPVEAKTHIALSDVFIGARMHATIAAFTAGLATVPVAYSRKFGGLYGSLGYRALVDLQEMDTDHAVEATLGYVEDRAHWRKQAVAGAARARNRITVFPEKLQELLGES